MDEICAKKNFKYFFFILLSNSYSESRPSQWDGQVVWLQQFIHDDFIYKIYAFSQLHFFKVHIVPIFESSNPFGNGCLN